MIDDRRHPKELWPTRRNIVRVLLVFVMRHRTESEFCDPWLLVAAN